MSKRSDQSFWHAFGPGVLFAGAAVGVSHLVQSTRAGAVYGFSLLLVVLLANLVKYPAFRFGPQYAAATGTSLLEGYRRQGRWALILYAVFTVGTMFTVQAAVTFVTAALLQTLIGFELSPTITSAGLLALCAGLLAVGHYHWLDRVVKALVALLTLSTIAATVLIMPRIDWSGISVIPSAAQMDIKSLVLVAGLVGWMPSAIDVSVWQSLWTLARDRDTGRRASPKDSLLDFHIGYLGTALLAICFLVLGAGVMHSQGIQPATNAPGFAAQIIALYTATLGAWARPVIGVSAFAVMFSTTLTVVDGFPRALAVLVERFRGAELATDAAREQKRNRMYWASAAIIAIGSIVIIERFLASLTAMVDLATTLSFLTAPILAWLNHRAIQSSEVPIEARPSKRLVAASVAGIVLLGAAALFYLTVRFFI